MMARSARLIAGTVLVLLVSVANAGAAIALFGSYWDNVARMTAHNDAAKVQQLVGNGADPNEVDDDGRTGLQIAAINDNVQIAAILIRASAHLDLKDKFGNTALHYAVERDHLGMARLLLDVGARVDPQNRNGMTPLMIAASRGYIAIVRVLLAKGANPQKTDFTGRDAVSWAEDSHRTAVVDALRRSAAER